MLAIALELDGWEVCFLGANTPVEDFAAMVEETQPRFVGLSVGMAYNLEQAAELVQAVRALPMAPAPKWMLGGQAFRGFPEVAASMQPDAMPASFADVVRVATGWIAD
jgi:methanogenic corrinoid protein MtbC1